MEERADSSHELSLSTASMLWYPINKCKHPLKKETTSEVDVISVYPVVPILSKLGQEDCEFVACLSYTEGLSQHRGASLSDPRKLGCGCSSVQVLA